MIFLYTFPSALIEADLSLIPDKLISFKLFSLCNAHFEIERNSDAWGWISLTSGSSLPLANKARVTLLGQLPAPTVKQILQLKYIKWILSYWL